MGLQCLCAKQRHPLLWAGSLAANIKITMSGKPNSLNCCVIFIVRTSFTDVAAERVIELGKQRATVDLQFVDPCSTALVPAIIACSFVIIICVFIEV
jgi:hypothetical protein